MSACAPLAPERETGCRALQGPWSASALERVPDDLIQSVRVEERLPVFDARITVGSE
jgi:hypothetical protein